MRRIGLVLVLALALAVPAGASESAPHVTDPCGDAGAMVSSGDDTWYLPEGRDAGFDIKSVLFEDLEEAGGVRVTLELCGDVPEARAFGSWWFVSWGLDSPDPSCLGQLHLNDNADQDEGFKRTARFAKYCAEESQDIMGETYWRSTSRFNMDLPTFAVEGPRIVWDLPADAFDGEAAEMLAPGTDWRTPRAWTRDLAGTLFTYQMGNITLQSGAHDQAGPGRDFVVDAATE
jgi:hypothetical protein